jgi:hypothetical protein
VANNPGFYEFNGKQKAICSNVTGIPLLIILELAIMNITLEWKEGCLIAA